MAGVGGFRVRSVVLISSLLLALSLAAAFAAPFDDGGGDAMGAEAVVGGVTYMATDSTRKYATLADGKSVTGDFDVPSTVIIGGGEYAVMGILGGALKGNTS